MCSCIASARDRWHATRTEALALVGGAVDVHLGGEHGAERYEHLRELRVAELLRQVVDEQVAALGARDHQLLCALLLLHRQRARRGRDLLQLRRRDRRLRLLLRRRQRRLLAQHARLRRQRRIECCTRVACKVTI